MSGTIINLIIQLIGGAIGGNAVGAAAKNVNLGNRRQHDRGRSGRRGWRVAPDLAHSDADGGRGRLGHWRAGWPVGRRRRIRRDRLGDCRHDPEKHAKRLSAFSRRAKYCCPFVAFTATIAGAARAGALFQSRLRAPAGGRSTSHGTDQFRQKRGREAVRRQRSQGRDGRRLAEGACRSMASTPPA